jgi:hypothetical protein
MPTTLAEFKRFFAIGNGVTALRPDQFFIYHVPKNKKVVVTDIYLPHVFGGNVSVSILEQTGLTIYGSISLPTETERDAEPQPLDRAAYRAGRADIRRDTGSER